MEKNHTKSRYILNTFWKRHHPFGWDYYTQKGSRIGPGWHLIKLHKNPSSKSRKAQMPRSPPSTQIPTICSVIISLCNFNIFRRIIKNKICQAYSQTHVPHCGAVSISQKLCPFFNLHYFGVFSRHGVCTWNQKMIRYFILGYFLQNVMTESYMKNQEFYLGPISGPIFGSLFLIFPRFYFCLFFLFLDSYCHAKLEKKLTKRSP